jgi:hypothetical protein
MYSTDAQLFLRHRHNDNGRRRQNTYHDIKRPDPKTFFGNIKHLADHNGQKAFPSAENNAQSGRVAAARPRPALVPIVPQACESRTGRSVAGTGDSAHQGRA